MLCFMNAIVFMGILWKAEEVSLRDFHWKRDSEDRK